MNGAKLEERKKAVLATMHRLDRPIWIGDLNPRASEHYVLRHALKALVAEGKVVRASSERGSRAYYELVSQGAKAPSLMGLISGGRGGRVS
jgi:DNA-binding HxlR family transcriptional regulator